MPIAGEHRRSRSELKLWRLCPFWQSAQASSSSSSTQHLHNHINHFNQNDNHRHHHRDCQHSNGSNAKTSPKTVSSVARSLLPARRRLRLDPTNHLYFPYEPGKQVRSAIKIKNTSKSHVAFKFQTTAPKSCFMRPPGGILSPGESLIATVFKFVEQPESNEKLLDLKTKVKFKLMSLKVKEGIEYVPELFDEQKVHVTVERILRVVFLDVDHSSPAMEKLKHQLAEAEAALKAQKNPPTSADNGPKVVGEGLVIDEWKERREKYLARQQVEAVDYE
ncbi:Vesicle-associated protein 4-1 [Ancistrocladus abbreviatus]